MTRSAIISICIAMPFVIGVATARPQQPDSTRDATIIECDVADDGDLLLIPVNISGNTYQFCLDTGCEQTVYDVSLRGLLGERISQRAFVSPNGGVAAVEECLAPQDARIGSLSMNRVSRVVVVDLSSSFAVFEGHARAN
jgi:hypothetical protein